MNRPVVAFDANLLVAGLLAWHEHHAVARRVLVDWLGKPPLPIVPIQALVESWAVMTRLPSPHGVSAQVAAELLGSALRNRCRLGALGEADGWSVFDALIEYQIVGGMAYDLQIIACAKAAGASRLYSLNRRDFNRLPSLGLVVVDPSRQETS